MQPFRYIFVIGMLMVFWLFVNGLAGSPLRFDHYTTADGLSQNTVRCLFQDKEGFLWIGTYDGLNRFDGINFKIFNRHNGLPNNAVECIAEKGNYLYICTDGGLCKLDKTTGKIVPLYVIDGRFPFQEMNRSISCTVLPNGKLLATAYRAIIVFDQNDKVERVFVADKSPASPTNPIGFFSPEAIDNDNLIWFSTRGGIQCYDYSKSLFYNYKNNPAGKSIFADGSAQGIILLKDKTIWYADYDKGLIHYDPASNKQKAYLPEGMPGYPIRITNIIQGHDGKIYCGTDAYGLWIFDPAAETWNPQKPDLKNPYGSHNFEERAILEDKEGNIWCGGDGGLEKISPLNQQFTILSGINSGGPNPIAGLGAVCQARDGLIWVGTSGNGIIKIDRDKNIQTTIRYGTAKQATPFDLIWNIHEDKNGRMWIGTQGGLNYIDEGETNLHLSHFLPPDLHFLETATTAAFFIDHKNNIWIGNWNRGVVKISADYKTSRYYDLKKEAGSSNNMVICLGEDKYGNIWIGQNDQAGICYIPQGGEQVFHIPYKHDAKNGLNEGTIMVLCGDATGKIWFGTHNSGLNWYDPKSQKFGSITRQEGLPSDVIRSLKALPNGEIWIGTSNGLCCYNPLTNKLKTFSAQNGLPETEFNGEPYFNASAGELNMLTSNTLVSFLPSQLKQNTYIPPLQITSINVMGKEIYPVEGQVLSLSYDKNYISFGFAALDYLAPGSNKYRYKLKDFEKDWHFTRASQSAYFSHLPPGEYTFLVQGSNSEGFWNTNGREIQFVIHPPFWQTWWFRSIVGLLLVSATYFLYRIRIARRMAEEKLRNKIARDLHDDMGSSLSNISILSQLAQNKMTAKDASARELLEKINDGTQNVMQSMSDIVWSINPMNDDMDRLIIRMREYASEILEARDIELKLETSSGFNKIQIPMENRRNLFLIYKEAINNMAKHSTCSKAEIAILLSGKTLVIDIKDNGKGFDSGQDDTGNGLRNMADRAKAMGAVFEIKTAPGEGTRIYFRMPIT